jgi:hypothetical protein
MKKVILLLALVMAITFVKAQDNTTKSTPAKSTTPGERPVRTAVQTKDLLKPISDDLAANYKDYKVITAFKLVKGDVTKYEVNVQKGTEKYKLMYDADGKFLEKKTPPAKATPGTKAAPTSTTPSSTTPAGTGTPTPAPDDQKK